MDLDEQLWDFRLKLRIWEFYKKLLLSNGDLERNRGRKVYSQMKFKEVIYQNIDICIVNFIEIVIKADRNAC